MKRRLLALVILGLMGMPAGMLQADTASYNRILQEQRLPVKYDAAVYSSAVKDQKSEGLCWSYIANGLLEGAMMKKEGITDPNAFNYSVSHMDYATSKTYAGSYGFDRILGDGGYFNIAVAYWNRQYYNGPVSSKMIASDESLKKYTASYQPDNVYVMRTASLDDLADDTTSVAEEKYIEEIKELVYRYGGAAASFYCSSYQASPENYSVYPYLAAKDVAYYCSTKQTPDHGGIIVGWDDQYSRENFNKSQMPKSDGAFLVKNSWGSQWGNKGYFWVSYETAFYNVNAITEVADRSFYDHLYEYDHEGLVGCVTYNDKLSTNAYMNKYQAGTASNEQLTAVSTYAVSGGNYYKVYVSTDGNPKHLKEVRLSNMGSYEGDKGYQAEYTGFMTMKLSEPLTIKAGSSFLAAVEVMQEGRKDSNRLVPVEMNHAGYSQGVVSAAGRSFIGPDIAYFVSGKKYDMNKDGANVCLKAYTKIE